MYRTKKKEVWLKKKGKTWYLGYILEKGKVKCVKGSLDKVVKEFIKDIKKLKE